MKLLTVKTAALVAASTMLCSTAAFACDDHAEKPAQMSEVAAMTKHQKAESTPVYRSPGKPGASVAMSYTMDDSSPAVGTDTRVSITYNSTTGGATLLSASVTPGAGLSIVRGPAESEFVMDGTAVTAEQEITVRSDQPGLNFVNVNVVLVSNGNQQRRSFAIPVKTSGVVSRKSTPGMSMKMGADGHAVVSMPAEEN